jgi:putative ABC transport system ATP-binding protein
MNILELQKVKFRYSESAPWVLDIDSFKVKSGERTFLFGPSGCGKTTFLEILAGVLTPQEGTYSFLGKDVMAMTSAQKDQLRSAHIGYIFQSFNLIPYLSVEENISLPLYLSSDRRKKVNSTEEKNEILRICEEIGIAELLKRPVTDLSVGQQQRVAVARALLGKPELILADEPTSALDHDHREKFIRLLFDVCKKEGTTVLFVSHDRSLQELFDHSVSLPQINQGGQK